MKEFGQDEVNDDKDHSPLLLEEDDLQQPLVEDKVASRLQELLQVHPMSGLGKLHSIVLL